jgi:acetoin utilization protein AcuB
MSAKNPIPPIRTVMTPFPYAVETDQPITEAKALMAAHDIRHLPVTEGGKVCGVISERDIRRALDPVFGLPPENELCVRDVFVSDVYVVQTAEPLDNVLAVMAERHLGSALVVKGEKLAGIFTVTDVCRHFCEFLRSQLPPLGGHDAA